MQGFESRLQGPGSGQEVREGFLEEVTLQLRLKSRSYPGVLDSVCLSLQITLCPPLGQRPPTSRLQTSTSCQISCSFRLEIKGTIDRMCLNHPDTMPHLRVHGKIVFHKTGPWCKKVWGPLLQEADLNGNIHLGPLLADILFILANGRHHQEIGEKEKGEVGCFYSRLLPVGCALLVSAFLHRRLQVLVKALVLRTLGLGWQLFFCRQTQMFHYLFWVSHNPAVLISYGCLNKVPQTGWLKTAGLLSHSSWG